MFGNKKEPTVKAASKFNSDDDAAKLNEAFKGFGTNEDVVTSIFAGRSFKQRKLIQEAYKAKFQKDLLDDLKSELSGDYLCALEGLLSETANVHAKYIKSIVSPCITLPGNSDIALLEVLCVFSKKEIDAVSSVYSALFKTSLLEDVKANVKGPFAAAVVALAENGRPNYTPVDYVHSLIPRLDSGYKTDEYTYLLNLTPEQWTPENNSLLDVLIKTNISSLRDTFNRFNKETEKDILELASTQPLPEFREGFKILVGSAFQETYFADQLYMSMKGLGTNDKKLIYIIIFRCEIDLKNIVDAFFEKYRCSLHDFIRDDTSGDYAKLMVALAGPETK